MKIIKTLFLLFIAINIYSQNNKIQKKEILTKVYAGSYYFGEDYEKEKTGYIIIYPESNDCILFYLSLNSGPPRLNMGYLYGRVKLKNGQGIYYNKFYKDDKFGCKLEFKFTKNSLIIKTLGKENYCDFGHTVYADGKYTRISKKIERCFEDSETKIICFDKIKPKEYYSN